MFKRFYCYKIKNLFVGDILTAYDKKPTHDGNYTYSCRFEGTRILYRKNNGNFQDPLSGAEYHDGISLSSNDETFAVIRSRVDLIYDLPDKIIKRDYFKYSEISDFDKKIANKTIKCRS